MPRRRSITADRQPGLALVPPGAPITDAARAAAARLHTIGNPGDNVWLEWRADRQQYVVAWYDRAARTRRRVATGIGAGPGVDPPREAHEALAARFAARVRPAAPLATNEVSVSTILTRYLAEHCGDIHDPARAAYAVKSIEAYIVDQRRRGNIAGMLTAAELGKAFVAGFAAFRRGQDAADATIKRELGVLRAAINWAAEDEMIAAKPYIPKLQGRDRLKTQRRQLAYTLPQLAALLEASWRLPVRHHVHLFIIAMLGSHARTEAILDCNLDLQYQDGVIDWLGGRELTKKRRSMTPVGPTLASWLEGRTGKLIRYRVELQPERWADPKVPEFYERDTWDIGRAFEKALIEAGAAHPSLKLRVPVLGPDGEQRTRLVKHRQGARFVEHHEPLWRGVGTPNTIRHTIHTQLRRIGVPKAVIDAASGHAEQGTGEHYNHFDARHDLKDLVAGCEQLFDELRHYTTAHLRTHNGPKIVDLGAARAAKSV